MRDTLARGPDAHRTLARLDEIGLFPLGMVLLPTERVPLHIFEPRYRELIGESLEREGEFGPIFADEDGLREVGTTAGVVEVLQRFPDGRLNVVVEGRERFRLLGLTSGRSFQTGRIEPLEDDETATEAPVVERALQLLRRVGELAGADVEDFSATSPLPSFELAAQVEFDPRIKQELLELRSEPERLRRLTGLLERAAEGLARRRAVAELAAGNGHPGPRDADQPPG